MNSTDREEILQRIRKAKANVTAVQYDPRSQRDLTKAGTIQASAALSMQARLIQQLERVNARVYLETTEHGLARILAQIHSELADNGHWVVEDLPALQRINWPAGIKVQHRHPQSNDEVAVSLAAAGIAESGSLVISGKSKNSSAICFLASHHIVLLPSEKILAYSEQAWQIVDKDLPRAIHLVSSPSKTADIEQTIVYGAHGPLSLSVVIVQSAGGI